MHSHQFFSFYSEVIKSQLNGSIFLFSMTLRTLTMSFIKEIWEQYIHIYLYTADTIKLRGRKLKRTRKKQKCAQITSVHVKRQWIFILTRTGDPVGADQQLDRGEWTRSHASILFIKHCNVINQNLLIVEIVSVILNIMLIHNAFF